MKRFATAAIAAATALSLAVVPAQAGEDTRQGSTAGLTDESMIQYIVDSWGKELKNPGSGVSAPHKASSESSSKRKENSPKSDFGPFWKFAYKNDAVNNYKLGTTADIIIGTSIAAAVLAVLGGLGAAQLQGLIQLPF